MSATTDITAYHERAERVLVETLTKGDSVFDTFGGVHALKSVVVFVKAVRLTRTDGVVSTFDKGTTITAVRGTGPIRPIMEPIDEGDLDAECDRCGGPALGDDGRGEPAWYVFDGERFCSVSCTEEGTGREVAD